MKMLTKHGNKKRESRNIEDKREYFQGKGVRKGFNDTLKRRLNNQARAERMKSEQKALQKEVNKGIKWKKTIPPKGK